MTSQSVQELVASYSRYLEQKEREALSSAEKIHVDEIASKIAAFYEKARNVIDYQEEHLLRKNTIGRILRRRVFLKDFGKNFAEPLIKELIRSGHLRNDAVPETKIKDVQNTINNLMHLLERSRHETASAREAMARWLTNVTVSAIEEELFPPAKDRMLGETMFRVIKNNLVVKGAEINEQERNIQLFLAVQRSLFKPDRDQLQYRLLTFVYPNWGRFNDAELPKIARELTNIKGIIERHLKTRLRHIF